MLIIQLLLLTVSRAISYPGGLIFCYSNSTFSSTMLWPKWWHAGTQSSASKSCLTNFEFLTLLFLTVATLSWSESLWYGHLACSCLYFYTLFYLLKDCSVTAGNAFSQSMRQTASQGDGPRFLAMKNTYEHELKECIHSFLHFSKV